jgi:nicotinamidase/pyrazinamidase
LSQQDTEYYSKEKKQKKASEYWEDVLKDAKRLKASPGASVPSKYSRTGTRKTALIVVDVQNDFLPPAGSLAVKNGTDVIPVINKLRTSMKFDQVAYSQDWHPVGHVSFCSTHTHKGAQLFTPLTLPTGKIQMMWPEHCIQGSMGAEFHKDLIIRKTDLIIRKGVNLHLDSYSGFYDNDHSSASELAPFLKKNGITDVFLAGIAYDYCVGYSALDAASDACRGVSPETIDAMKTKLRAGGVKIIQSSDMLRSTPMS